MAGRKRFSKTYSFEAILPGKRPGDPNRHRFYRTASGAKAARTSSWVEANRQKWMINQACVASARAEKCTPSERKFIAWAAERAVKLQRAGWPDFLAESPTGGFAGVEVKRTPTDPLRPVQSACFDLLEKAGVKIFVWVASTKRMIPWKDHDQEWRSDERTCLSGRTSQDNGGQETPKPADANPAADDRSHGALTSPVTVH